MLLQAYLYLVIAIVSEVIGTAALKETEGFTRLPPSVVTLISYGLSIYFLSLTLKALPIGIAYAIWSGVGIIFIALIGLFWFRQPLDLPAIIGLALIVAGVVVVNGFSRSIGH
jgi:small multidrug resistance pump